LWKKILWKIKTTRAAAPVSAAALSYIAYL
jgi:hypothetical protein